MVRVAGCGANTPRKKALPFEAFFFKFHGVLSGTPGIPGTMFADTVRDTSAKL